MPSFRLFLLLFVFGAFAGLSACAPAQQEPARPEIRISGSWEIGASKTKGF